MTPRGLIQRGTTSACAENTLWPWPWPCGGWNYLRVRGEYSGMVAALCSTKELPPRARRIRGSSGGRVGGFGTTSACAENTGQFGYLIDTRRNYLRVRGEYPK